MDPFFWINVLKTKKENLWQKKHVKIHGGFKRLKLLSLKKKILENIMTTYIL